MCGSASKTSYASQNGQSGACDLANTRRIGRKTSPSHIDVQMFPEWTKVDSVVSFEHIPGPDKEADIFKKNFNAG